MEAVDPTKIASANSNAPQPVAPAADTIKQPTTVQERIEFNNKYGPAAPMAAGMLPPYGKNGYINPDSYLRYSRDKKTNPMYNGKPFGGIDAINKIRESDGYLHPISKAPFYFDNDDYNAKNHALITRLGSEDTSVNVPVLGPFNFGTYVRMTDDLNTLGKLSPQDREINGFEVQRMGDKGMKSVNKVMPDMYSTGGHEADHYLNFETSKGRAKVEEQAKKHNLSIPNVYFGYEPGEVAPNMSRLKNFGRYRGIDVDAPDGMQNTFEAFRKEPFDPKKAPEWQRTRNQFESYTNQLKAEGSVPMKDKQPIAPQAIKNWQTLYGHYWPGVAKNQQQVRPPLIQSSQRPIQTQPAQPQPPIQAPQYPQPPVPPAPSLAKQARVASTLNSSYNSLMNEARMMKIAAVLQKATDNLKLSDRPTRVSGRLFRMLAGEE